MLTIGSLFSGIGGLELGLERAGLGPVKWQVEIDDYCNNVLEKHWPDARRYRDIKSIREGELEPVDLICGGFPCQPVSCAGSRKAQSDDRWLWPEFVRILRMVKPRWVVAENVPGLLTADSDGAMGEVLRDLALCGYGVEWDCISAQSVGAWHRRDRIFIVAHADANGCEGPSVHLRRGRPFETPALISGGSPDVPDPEGERGKRWTPGLGIFDSQFSKEILGWCRARNVSDAQGNLRPPPRNEGRETSNWHGAKDGRGIWSVEPSVGRVASRVPSRMDRLKCLGNAVVPQVAEVIGLLIMEHERVMTEGA